MSHPSSDAQEASATAVPELDDSPVPRYFQRLRMDGRAAIVAGAGQGIGRQTAHALADVGARVLCVDIDPGRAEHVAAEVNGLACIADATTREGASRIVSQACDPNDGVGGVDVLVDIIGMARYGPLLDATDDDWDASFAIVLRHAFLLTQLAGRHMAERGHGAIVLIASISGITGAPNHGPYGAAKAGVISLTRTAALELGPYGVRVNAVAPGAIRTPRTLAKRAAGKAATQVIEALGKEGMPSDVADAALYLASDLAGHVTGQVLTVDGGATVRFPYM